MRYRYIGDLEKDMSEYDESIRYAEQSNCRVANGKKPCEGVGNLNNPRSSCYDCPSRDNND